MAKKKNAPGGVNNAGSPHVYMVVGIGELKPYTNNAKQHPPWHIKQIADSIRQFGFITPIIIDDKYEIVCGHGRHKAAEKLGLKQVPVILVSNLTDAELHTYRITDNKLNMNTGFDEDLIAVEIKYLDGLDLDFDLEVTGLTTGELDIIIGSEVSEENDEADEIPEIPNIPVTKNGDIWRLGDHLILCGNSLDAANYKALMNGETADAVFSDPPYNVPVSGHICGNGKIKHDEFAMASGEMSNDEFQQFLAAIITLLIEFSKNGSLHYICMDWRGIHQLLSAGNPQYHELKNICIWNKDNGGMGSLYRSKHEMIAVYKHGRAQHTNNILLGKHGRYRTNIWNYRGVSSFGGKEDLKLHPTVKPVALVADAILDCTRRGEIVLDVFGGSGSTLIAAELTGRKARLIELEPKYVDVTIQRWQELTDLEAVHAETGKTFNETAQTQGE